MKTETLSMDRLREDLLTAMQSRNARQKDVVSTCGISQGVLSNFILKKRGLAFSSLVKLWPFVYGCPFSPPDTVLIGNNAQGE